MSNLETPDSCIWLYSKVLDQIDSNIQVSSQYQFLAKENVSNIFIQKT